MSAFRPIPDIQPVLVIKAKANASGDLASKTNRFDRITAHFWLRKSAGLPLNAVRIPKAAKDEMFRLNAITRPPEMPLPCTLYRTFEKVVTRVNRVRSVLSVSAT